MSKPFSTQFISIMNAKIVVLLLAFMLSACDQPVSEGGEKKYSVVGVEIVNGVPSHESSKQLYLAMDYYGAVQAYLWAMPAMGLKGWENANLDMGADPTLDGQISLYQGYDGAAGILTPNTEVTYVISFDEYRTPRFARPAVSGRIPSTPPNKVTPS